MLDIVTNRSELRDKLIRIIGLLRQPAPPGEVLALPDSNDTVETETIMPKTATPAIDPPRPD